jgi:ATP-dependent DNA ligase
MKLDTLYKRDSNDGIRQWTIEINSTGYRTHSGLVGGKIVTSEWFKVMATNVGRANHRTLSEQAIFEAQAKWQKKIDSGYSTNQVSCNSSEVKISPMLAKKWEDRKDKISFPLASQPKLDGMRCWIDANGAWTRNGKRWMTVDFLTKELEGFFKSHPNAILDGELYSHELKHDFNKISSLIKKTKPTAADLQECESKIKYHIYDCIIDPQKPVRFLARMQSVFEIVKRLPMCFVAVSTSIANNQSELDALYGEYLEDGFEGQMVRLPNSPYEFKRSVNLLKRKEFQDDEYQIVEIGEGNGNKSGMAGFAVCRHPDGRTFNSNIKGNHDFLKDLLVNRDAYIGTYATCTYFNLTPDGIPRFPYITKLRDGVGID